ncbi:hypothetical protein D3C87_324530 [compost metagenome]
MKIYPLSITRDYVSRWGMVEAVRELIQNSLDSSAAFKYEFKKEFDGSQTLLLTSEDVTLAPHTLLLGATGKRHSSDTIGSFGEGYKLAMLVLLREGYEINILNGCVEWFPKFEFSRAFGYEQLVIEETPLTKIVNTSLIFRVAGLTDTDVEAIRGCCLRMQGDIGAIRTTAMGEILLDRPNELYVGDLFVCKTDMDFGYNVLPRYLKLERDRQTVDGWDLGCLTRDMWYATKDYDEIATLIARECPDLEYARYSSPEIVKEACYQLFKEKHPGEVIAETNAQLQSLVKQGMTVYVGGGTLYHTVSNSPSYRKEMENKLPKKLSPAEILEQWLKENRKEMRGKAIESFRKEILQDKALEWK